jgi:GntR family transcriptional regulator / MocR family aminotransferase
MQALLDGRLKPGARLPSTRNLAAQYGLSRGMVTAFDQLQAATGNIEVESSVR